MATAAAAAVAKARRDVQHVFFSHDAVRPDQAVPFEAERRLQQRVFDRMVRRGIVREAKPGHYWLDVVAYDRDLRARLTRVRWALAIVLVFLALVLLFPVLS